ncbi:MAG: hypothetical protein AB8B89_08245 [Gammaproteobacteria bacterium]
MVDNAYKQVLLPTLSLFGSVSTLVCCALPALFVTVGMGAALAGLVSAAPWLITISEYKEIVFLAAGLLLLMSAVVQWRARNQACPAEVKQAKACARLRRFNWMVLIFSILVYLVGFFFAFLAAELF